MGLGFVLNNAMMEKKQNSGVMVRGEYQNMSYYGLITDIIEVRYTKGILFFCLNVIGMM